MQCFQYSTWKLYFGNWHCGPSNTVLRAGISVRGAEPGSGEKGADGGSCSSHLHSLRGRTTVRQTGLQVRRAGCGSSHLLWGPGQTT